MYTTCTPMLGMCVNHNICIVQKLTFFSTTDADLKARAANLRQVSDYIKSHSSGNAVVVFGDSNTRYTRAADIPAIFSQQNGMKDVWIELVRKNNVPVGGASDIVCTNPSTTTACETVDKVWYRGTPAITLQATTFDYAGDMFLQPDGNILSDHNPVLVDFTWTLGSQFRVGDAFGGEFGDWFNDLDAMSAAGKSAVSSVTLRGKDRLDAVEMTLASGKTFTHGGTGGTASTLKLSAGETLVGATICQGEKDKKTRVFFTELRTSAGKKVSAGVKTGTCVERTAAQGWSFNGFLGRSGDEIDKLGFVSSKV
jgi:hypothetical protein